jgi:hypothetical protein
MEQTGRQVSKYAAPTLNIVGETAVALCDYDEGRISFNTLFKQFKIEDFKLDGYQSYPTIKVEMLERNMND